LFELEIEMAAKAGIPPVLFALITEFTQRLQVADVVAAALGKGNDVINLELHLWRRLAATATAEAIPLEDVLPHSWRDEDALVPFRFPHGGSNLSSSQVV
jgi:hypothetical protein